MKSDRMDGAFRGSFKRTDDAAGGKGRDRGVDKDSLDRDARKLDAFLRKGAGKDGDASGDGPAALFGGMAGLIGEKPTGAAQAAAASEAGAAAEAAHCEELVNRILVSTPESGGSSEVRLRLDESWLPRTEVSLTRDADGSLTVEFLSDSVESQRFLLPNLGALRARLDENVDAPRVVVRMSEDASGGDNREGRHSRERRNLYEEMGD